MGLAVDASTNLYIADTGNSRIRKVDSDGTITTIAGTGEPGYSGEGGPAIGAQLKMPHGIAIDTKRNTYVTDTQPNAKSKSQPTP